MTDDQHVHVHVHVANSFFLQKSDFSMVQPHLRINSIMACDLFMIGLIERALSMYDDHVTKRRSAYH